MGFVLGVGVWVVERIGFSEGGVEVGILVFGEVEGVGSVGELWRIGGIRECGGVGSVDLDCIRFSRMWSGVSDCGVGNSFELSRMFGVLVFGSGVSWFGFVV